jgi:NTP pyrophosphatase (non-canonical NTP hydrolase)
MDANEYQKLAARTLIDHPDFVLSDWDILVIWSALGLAGEAGEVANLVKKGILHQHGLDRAKLENELGDVLWYAAALCSQLGIDMGEVMQANVDKLLIRYPAGYSPADSQRRVDASASGQPANSNPGAVPDKL